MIDLMERDDLPSSAAAISPDGQRILVATPKELRLRDAATGQPVGEPWIADPSRTSAIGRLTFSPDGRYVVSSDVRTSQLQVWDVKTGRPVGSPLTGHGGIVLDVGFTADGNHFVSRGVDDGWVLWPSPNGWDDELCDKLAANMTRAEWNDWVSPDIDYRTPCPSLPAPE